MGIKIQVGCTRCRITQLVDLAALSASKGADYNLHNRRCRCRLTPGCPGWNRFFHNRSSIWLPFWDDRTAVRWFESDH